MRQFHTKEGGRGGRENKGESDEQPDEGYRGELVGAGSADGLG